MEQGKKVEYIELIYDLIFVYIIGRNNHLLHVIKNGFIDPASFLTYVLASLVILQIWYYTSLYINKYGENDKLMHGAIFVNMYLLYFMARGINSDWHEVYYIFNGAWLLILLNIALQYYLQLRKTDTAMPWATLHIKWNIRTILMQCGFILMSMPLYHFTGLPLSPLAMLLGVVMAIAGRNVNNLAAVDFGHLTERVMLYVVFTFGEMIIAITDYFEGGFSGNTLYYSMCAFLIVAGLFVSYGLLYDRMIDRETGNNATAYMMIHVILILSLNHITAALEYMREPEISELPKNIFLIGSFILFYLMLFIIMFYNRPEYRPDRPFMTLMLVATGLFTIVMLAVYKNPGLSIAVTVAYIWIVFISLLMLIRKGRNGGDI